MRNNPRHHIAADESRWVVGPRSGIVQVVNKCGARFGHYRCDRWPHHGYHGTNAHSPEETAPSVAARRIEWTGTGANAREREVADDPRSVPVPQQRRPPSCETTSENGR